MLRLQNKTSSIDLHTLTHTHARTHTQSYTHYFSDNLNNQWHNSTFIQPTDNEIIAGIISAFNINISSVADSIHFWSGAFLSLLKIAKAVPVFQNYKRLEYNNYNLVSFLFIIGHFLSFLFIIGLRLNGSAAHTLIYPFKKSKNSNTLVTLDSEVFEQ